MLEIHLQKKIRSKKHNLAYRHKCEEYFTASDTECEGGIGCGYLDLWVKCKNLDDVYATILFKNFEHWMICSATLLHPETSP